MMGKLLGTFRRWQRNYDLQPMRQRMLSIVVVLMCLVLALDLGLLRPISVRRQHAILALKESRSALDALNGQLGRYILPRKTKSQVVQETAEKPWWSLRQDLIPPDRTAGLLRDLVVAEPGLKLEQLETLPAVVLVPDTAGAKKIWQHRQRLKLKGEYFALRNYLHRLETGPWRLYWEELTLEADGSGQAGLTVLISSLSEDAPWLSL
ncbi:hypothetical protein ACUHMQ_17550 [Chitinimonas sp. PSY-7]|uniref:hypothetical protein n=1 Tax=Chitinimonas sp. PSY-7 TaxID=3459088 RepID=UPI00403FD378